MDKQYLTSVNADQSGSYTVSAGKLSLRARPNTKSRRLATLTRGTVLYVSKLNGDWGYVTHGGQSGWVAMKYLKKGGETKAADVKAGSTYTVVCETLNVRRRANGTRIDTLKQGATVRVSRVSGDWAYVSYSKNHGERRMRLSSARDSSSGAFCRPALDFAREAGYNRSINRSTF